MKKELAKTYSTEKIADIYLAALALDEGPGKSSVLPEVLRQQNIYFDQEIIAGVTQLLETRKYIEETGFVSRYILLGDVIIQSILPDSLKPNNALGADFSSVVKGYKITGPGARFVRLGQVIDIQGKIEHEAERKKRKERLVTFIIALAVSILTTLVKSAFDKPNTLQKRGYENAPKNLRF